MIVAKGPEPYAGSFPVFESRTGNIIPIITAVTPAIPMLNDTIVESSNVNFMAMQNKKLIAANINEIKKPLMISFFTVFRNAFSVIDKFRINTVSVWVPTASARYTIAGIKKARVMWLVNVFSNALTIHAAIKENVRPIISHGKRWNVYRTGLVSRMLFFILSFF